MRKREGDKPQWTEVGGMLVLVLAFLLLLKHFNVLTVSANVEGALGYGTIFSIGLVAALSSCMAMVGGLLLSVSAKWGQEHQAVSRWQRFAPLFSFNVGRLAGYFVLGGLVGVVGSGFIMNVRLRGIVVIGIALVMLLLGLNILRILPKRYCTIPLPRAFQERLRNLSESSNPVMPGLIGALTFFVPCGFTQAMQLYALGTGNFWEGGIVMFIFALGTLPSLLGISVVSSVVEGRAGRFFLHFAGAMTLLLGLAQLNSGFLLLNVDAAGTLEHLIFPSSRLEQQASDPAVTIDSQGRQIVAMRVSQEGFTPSRVTIRPNLDTWVYAYTDVRPELLGCASTIVAPAYNASVVMQQGGNWLHLGTSKKQDFQIVCSLAILRMDIHVTQE